MPPGTKRLRGYLLLAAGMSLVGCYVALSKPLTAVLPVPLLATLRFAIAALAMLHWLVPSAGDARLTTRLTGQLVAQSFFGNYLFSLMMLSGVALTSATAAGVILAMLPVVVALFSWWFLHERLSRRGWAAVALAVLGLVVLSGARGTVPEGGPALAAATGLPGSPDASWLGDLLILGCVACEAIYVILGKCLTGQLSARRICALINLIGLVLMAPWGLWQASTFDFAMLQPWHWGLLVFYALAASMVSTWLWLTGLQQVPASHSGVFTVALPLTATIVGIVALGETPQWQHLVALACAVAGVVVISRTP